MTHLLTTNETAQLLRTNTHTLAFWRTQGTGPRWAKVGRRVLYRREDVETFVEQRFAEATA